MVSQFVRDMSAAESALVEAAIHRDAGAHRVVAEMANMNAAKATEMRASGAAEIVLASPGQRFSLTCSCALGLTL